MKPVKRVISYICIKENWMEQQKLTETWYILGVKVQLFCHVWLFVTPWTVTYHMPPSTGFSRQEYWNGLPFPSPGIVPSQEGIEPRSPAL